MNDDDWFYPKKFERTVLVTYEEYVRLCKAFQVPCDDFDEAVYCKWDQKLQKFIPKENNVRMFEIGDE